MLIHQKLSARHCHSEVEAIRPSTLQKGLYEHILAFNFYKAQDSPARIRDQQPVLPNHNAQKQRRRTLVRMSVRESSKQRHPHDSTMADRHRMTRM